MPGVEILLADSRERLAAPQLEALARERTGERLETRRKAMYARMDARRERRARRGGSLFRFS